MSRPFLLMTTFSVLSFSLSLLYALQPDSNIKPMQVLLIGNSQCPTIIANQLIENLAKSDSKEGSRSIKIVGCIKGGASLKSHWDAGLSPMSARSMIASGTYNFIVLQDIYNVEEPAFAPYARLFCALIKEKSATPILFSTASIISDYPRGFERLHRIQLALGKELGVPVVDSSYAYLKYLGEKPSTERLESLFAKDKAHLGLWGSYIYSCGIYSAITNRNPINLAAPHSIPVDVVKQLQEAAWLQHQETKSAMNK